ncbi:MAG TPA: hypothetical protein VEK57_27310 [Thermoanaerobaculia bacterium]|nr:hypothetical protein [Thermoanaerobaculia bacterium]
MNTLKIVVRIAAFAGLLLLAGVQAEASGCCDQDCTDAYGTMLNSGVPAGDAAAWYRDCLKACKEHGDPTTCPAANAMAAGNGTEASPVPDAVPGDVAPRRGVEPDVIAVFVPRVVGQHSFVPIPPR